MTRINVVPEQELSDQHLAGEYHEISRVFELVRKSLSPILGKPRRTAIAIPSEYLLGRGHVMFFYDKLGYVARRYISLALEMRYRAFKRGQDSAVDMRVVLEIIECAHDSIPDEKWWRTYQPTPEAIELNRQRIEERS